MNPAAAVEGGDPSLATGEAAENADLATVSMDPTNIPIDEEDDLSSESDIESEDEDGEKSKAEKDEKVGCTL